MQWTAVASCLGVNAKTKYRRKIEYGIANSFIEITEEELEWNIREILRLTPFSGESYVRGAFYAIGEFISSDGESENLYNRLVL